MGVGDLYEKYDLAAVLLAGGLLEERVVGAELPVVELKQLVGLGLLDASDQLLALHRLRVASSHLPAGAPQPLQLSLAPPLICLFQGEARDRLTREASPAGAEAPARRAPRA
jgi:hypothetical protein